jgi:hypothetical protein
MKLVYACSLAALVCSAAALAENPNWSSRGAAPSRGNMAQAFGRVTINQAKNPQSQGLTNARNRIIVNAEKHADNGPNRVERPERALPPSVTDRPTVAAFRDRAVPPGLVDKPLPPGLVGRERPLPPGHRR